MGGKQALTKTSNRALLTSIGKRGEQCAPLQNRNLLAGETVIPTVIDGEKAGAGEIIDPNGVATCRKTAGALLNGGYARNGNMTLLNRVAAQPPLSKPREQQSRCAKNNER